MSNNNNNFDFPDWYLNSQFIWGDDDPIKINSHEQHQIISPGFYEALNTLKDDNDINTSNPDNLLQTPEHESSSIMDGNTFDIYVLPDKFNYSPKEEEDYERRSVTTLSQPDKFIYPDPLSSSYPAAAAGGDVSSSSTSIGSGGNSKSKYKHHYICPYSTCNYETNRRNNLERHLSTMHGTLNTPIYCCNIEFTTKYDYKYHHNECHLKDSAGYKCTVCPKTFERKALLDRHIKVHLVENELECHKCRYKTTNKSNFNRHLLTHDNNNNNNKCSKRKYTRQHNVNNGQLKKDCHDLIDMNSPMYVTHPPPTATDDITNNNIGYQVDRLINITLDINCDNGEYNWQLPNDDDVTIVKDVENDENETNSQS